MLCENCQVLNVTVGRLLTELQKKIIYEEIHQEETIWPCFSDVKHMKSSDKRVNFSWFYVTNVFHASLTIVRKYTPKENFRVENDNKNELKDERRGYCLFWWCIQFFKKFQKFMTKLFELVQPETSLSGLLRSAERYPLKRVPANSIFTAPPVHLGRLWLKSQS